MDKNIDTSTDNAHIVSDIDYNIDSVKNEEIYIEYLKNVLLAIEQHALNHALCPCAMAWWAKNDKTIEGLDNIEAKYCGKLLEYQKTKD